MFKRRHCCVLALSLLIVGCPAPSHSSLPIYQGTPASNVSYVPTASSSSTASLAPVSVSGVAYSFETGQPVSGATVVLDDTTQLSTGADGSFTATRSPYVFYPDVTVLQSGFANLTVNGYKGGALLLPLRTAVPPLATQSMTVSVASPPGSTTAAVVSVAVKPAGYAFAISRFFGSVSLSAAGTGSATIAVPNGDATVVAYGSSGQWAGSTQAPVATTVQVSLAAAPAPETYQVNVPLLKTDGSVLSEATYYLTWPGDTPARPSTAMIADITGSSTAQVVGLPPASSFGIPGAYYSVIGQALGNTASRPVLGFANKSHVAQGPQTVSVLAAANWTFYHQGDDAANIPFRVDIDQPIAGANAYYADFYPYTGGGRLWKVVSLGTSTGSLFVPVLPSALRSTYGLVPHTNYGITVGSGIDPVSAGLDQAQTFGNGGGAYYNGP